MISQLVLVKSPLFSWSNLTLCCWNLDFCWLNLSCSWWNSEFSRWNPNFLSKIPSFQVPQQYLRCIFAFSAGEVAATRASTGRGHKGQLLVATSGLRLPADFQDLWEHWKHPEGFIYPKYFTNITIPISRITLRGNIYSSGTYLWCVDEQISLQH